MLPVLCLWMLAAENTKSCFTHQLRSSLKFPVSGLPVRQPLRHLFDDSFGAAAFPYRAFGAGAKILRHEAIAFAVEHKSSPFAFEQRLHSLPDVCLVCLG